MENRFLLLDLILRGAVHHGESETKQAVAWI